MRDAERLDVSGGRCGGHLLRRSSGIAAAALLLLLLAGCAGSARPKPTPMPDLIEEAARAVERGDWAGAERAVRAVDTGWDRARTRFQLFASRSELDAFERALNRLWGAIAVRDRAAARIAIAELAGIWQELTAL